MFCLCLYFKQVVPPLPPSPTPRRRLQSVGADFNRQPSRPWLNSPRPFYLLQKNSLSLPGSPPGEALLPSFEAGKEQEMLSPLSAISPRSSFDSEVFSPTTAPSLTAPSVMHVRTCHAHSQSSPLRMSKIMIEHWERGRTDYLQDASGYLTPADIMDLPRSPELETGSPGTGSQDALVDDDHSVPSRPNSLLQQFLSSDEHIQGTQSPKQLLKKGSVSGGIDGAAAGLLHLEQRKEVVYAEVGPPSKLQPPVAVDSNFTKPFSSLLVVKHKKEFASSPNLRLTLSPPGPSSAQEDEPPSLPHLHLVSMDGSPIRRKEMWGQSSLGGSPSEEVSISKPPGSGR